MAGKANAKLELPGAELIEQGIADLGEGRETQAALAVATAASRLRAAGLDVPRTDLDRPSHRLYALLARAAGDDAHGRYNAILRRVSSFARALEGQAQSRS